MAGETGQEFIDRMLAMLGKGKANGNVASTTATSEIVRREAMDGGNRPTKRVQVAGPVLDPAGSEPVRKSVSRPVRVRPATPKPLGAAVTDERPATTKWPPQIGERYVGNWPPRALYDRAKRARELCKPMPKSTRYVEG
jgi:hypothetical protein